jgi:hypothetical protein
MHKETLIHVITCTWTPSPPPPISSTTMIFPTFLMWRDPNSPLKKSMVQTSNIQTHNLKTPTYAKTYIGIGLMLMLPQTRFKRCGISFLNEVWGGPKRSKKQNSHIVAHRISILKMESKNWWGEGVRGEKT